MNIIEEYFKKEPKKDNTRVIAKIILIIIVLLVLVIVGILITMAYINNSQLRVYVDGQVSDDVKNLLIIEEDGTVYIHIKEIASYLGYSSYNGEYTNRSEDRSKCFVQSENEAANFTLGSNEIYKLRLTGTSSTGQNYEIYYMNNPVTSRDGKLYTTQEGLMEAFNVSFDYNRETNRIQIYTMQFKIDAYENSVLDAGYTSIQNDFNNHKAVLEDMLVVEQNSSYGVIKASTKEVLIEPKYNQIEYLPETNNFLITSNGQVGILAPNGDTKVQLIYDRLELMDSDSEIYLAERDGRYGVVDINGNIIIHLDYDEIGIDITKFSDNDIKNKYILADNLIPVRKDGYWGFFDKTGKQVKDFMYDTIGYSVAASRDQRNLLVIPEYNLIVVGRDKKYGLINNMGEEIVILALDDAYMVISGGEKKYYMTYNDNRMDIEEYLEQQGVPVDKNTTNKSTNNTNISANDLTGTTTID